jgi:peptide/nickel transport system ATP-binding protein
MQPVLEVAHLSAELGRGVKVISDISFALAPGETLALVGESGCGKSMTALALMGLLPPRAAITGGAILLRGRNLAAADMRTIRGAEMTMIFQEPQSALNPVLSIGEQVMEAVRAHHRMSQREARAAALDLLARVRLPDPVGRFGEFPHRLSGGMCQRVMIAMALAGAPSVLIADEPTTALDVSVQAQILELIAALQQESGMAVLLITHDLGLVAGYADRVAVMYAGRIVETAPVQALFSAPAHPYTVALLRAAPGLTPESNARFAEIPGLVPALGQRPPGCAFAPRCGFAQPACRAAIPPWAELSPDHRAACILP